MHVLWNSLLKAVNVLWPILFQYSHHLFVELNILEVSTGISAWIFISLPVDYYLFFLVTFHPWCDMSFRSGCCSDWQDISILREARKLVKALGYSSCLCLVWCRCWLLSRWVVKYTLEGDLLSYFGFPLAVFLVYI